MKIATAWSTDTDTANALQTTFAQLCAELGEAPHLLIVHYAATHEAARVASILHALAPDAALQGGSSCLGVMTREGFHATDAAGLGLLGVADAAGSYGVGAARFGDDPRAAARAAVEAALEASDEAGALPAVIWLTAAPGHEEDLLLGVEDVLGSGVPILGGSSGDNDVSGRWTQLAGGEHFHDAVVVGALFPSTPVMFAFHSGYEPTGQHGQVTRAEGRVIHTIDDRPAAAAYDAWTGGALHAHLTQPGNVLAHTTLHPLARRVGAVGGVPCYQLVHPDAVLDGGALSLFARVEVGETLTLMEGSPDTLATRAGRVARAALSTRGATPARIAGGLVIYCAGCMLTIQHRMDEVAASLRDALGERPFLGTFTFGEQGCFIGGENRHGNLMISILLFGS